MYPNCWSTNQITFGRTKKGEHKTKFHVSNNNICEKYVPGEGAICMFPSTVPPGIGLEHHLPSPNGPRDIFNPNGLWHDL